MKNILYIMMFGCFLLTVACEIEDIPNPNGPSIEGVLVDATKSQLQTLVTGSEDLTRQDLGFYYDVTSIVGREYYFFTGSDPRYTGEVLGKGESTLDNAGFYGTRPYQGRFRTVKNLQVLMDAAQGSSVLTAEELAGYMGYAQTMQAYEMHLALNLQGENGIRTEVSDINNLGPFRSYDDALSDLRALLNTANDNLGNAGSSFAFSLSSAMQGFDTPATFAQFNRGLAARLALYDGDSSGAMTALGSSFMDGMGDLSAGPGRYYSAAGGDFANNIFRVPDQADAIIAHPSFVADAEAGDDRLDKVLLRPSGTLSLDGLSGDYDVWVFRSLEDAVPFMTNEELVLIMAEANIGTNNSGAVSRINLIRNAHGLDNYSGDETDEDALLNEVLYQRRYSLFGLGHRWVDMRRTGKLSELPLDRVGDDVWSEFPRPVSENQ